MGLFDFFKGSGDEVENEANMASELQKKVSAMDLNIDNLHVAFDDGTATLSGEAPNVKNAEIARLVVGNHKGVEKVNDDGLKVVEQAEAAAAESSERAGASASTEMYTVEKGDTLGKIAERKLGASGRYQEIFEANKPMLNHPDKIYPGQVLRIPTAQA